MKKKFLIKFVSAFAIVFLIFGGFVLKTQKTEALFGEPQPVIVISGHVIVSDPAHTGITTGGWLKEVWRFAEKYHLDVLLNSLKKRLLDTMVDQIIGWIQNPEGGKPQFVQDFGDTVEKAGNAAVGDFIQELPLAPICAPFKARLQMDLKPPPRFQNAVSCTLDQVINNFEDFYNDFENGGWIGFSEALKPQNNYGGALIISFEELNSRVEKAQTAKEKEISVGQGFLSQKECLEWTLYGADEFGESFSRVYPVNSDFPYYNSSNEPPFEPPYVPTGEIYSPFSWVCTKTNITTPGTTIAHGLEKALYSDIDYILSANELSAYIGAIADAAINRAIREGVRGVQNIGKAGSTTNEERIAWESQNFNASTTEAINNYDEGREMTIDEVRKTYLKPINEALELTITTASTLSEAKTKNEALYNTLLSLIQCLENRNSPSDLAWAREQAEIATTTTRTVIENKQNELTTIINPLETLKTRVENARTLRDLTGIDTNEITNYKTRADNLGLDAETILNGVKQTLDEAKRRRDANGCPVAP